MTGKRLFLVVFLNALLYSSLFEKAYSLTPLRTPNCNVNLSNSFAVSDYFNFLSRGNRATGTNSLGTAVTAANNSFDTKFFAVPDTSITPINEYNKYLFSPLLVRDLPSSESDTDKTCGFTGNNTIIECKVKDITDCLDISDGSGSLCSRYTNDVNARISDVIYNTPNLIQPITCASGMPLCINNSGNTITVNGSSVSPGNLFCGVGNNNCGNATAKAINCVAQETMPGTTTVNGNVTATAIIENGNCSYAVNSNEKIRFTISYRATNTTTATTSETGTTSTTDKVYNNYTIKQKGICYPDKHICNTYKSDYTNRYFYVDKHYIDVTVAADEVFYIYKKTAVPSDLPNGIKKNCNLDILPCDFKVKNENTTATVSTTSNPHLNVTPSSTTDLNNMKFVENVMSGDLGEATLFKYAGFCVKNGTNSTCYGEIGESSDSLDIMRASYYFKMAVANSDNTTNIYYFKKNISLSPPSCNGYLPSCNDIKPEDRSPLFDDRDGTDNKRARNSFYKSIIENSGAVINEENLLLANYSYFTGVNCLSLRGSASNATAVGYCSDLTYGNSADSISSSLVHSNGISSTYTVFSNYDVIFKAPSCYFKSCIDLTGEEISKINNTDKKFCSEYVWLNNEYGFKYFPREKPPYCSDVNADGLLKYPQGFEINNPKCYVKNCYSLEDNERSAVVKKKYENLIKKFKWGFNACERVKCVEGVNAEGVAGFYTPIENEEICDFVAEDIGVCDGVEHTESEMGNYKMPFYCKGGYFFDKNTDFFRHLDVLNFNILRCSDFSGTQLSSMNKAPILFTKPLLPGYETYSVKSFCRTHVRPLHKYAQQDVAGGFLQTSFIGDNEIAEASLNGSYTSYFANRASLGSFDNFNSYDYNRSNTFNLPVGIDEETDYGKISYHKLSHPDLVGITTPYFDNYCSYIDNLFLYKDADIDSLSYFTIPNPNANSNDPNIDLIAGFNDNSYNELKIKITNKATNFNTCIGEGGCERIRPTQGSEQEAAESLCYMDCGNESDVIGCLNEKFPNDCGYLKCKVGCENNNPSEARYSKFEENIIKEVVNCSKYNSTKRVYGLYYDCDLYMSNNSLIRYMVDALPIKNIATTPSGKDNKLVAYIADLQKSCTLEFQRLIIERTVVPESISAYIKPYVPNTGKLVGYDENFRNKVASSTVTFPIRTGKRMHGCSPALSDDSVSVTYPYDYAAYISTKSVKEGAKIINHMTASESDKFNNLFFTSSVCVRTMNNMGLSANARSCGVREGVTEGDFCAEYNLAKEEDNVYKSHIDGTGNNDVSIRILNLGRSAYFTYNIGAKGPTARQFGNADSNFKDDIGQAKVHEECWGYSFAAAAVVIVAGSIACIAAFLAIPIVGPGLLAICITVISTYALSSAITSSILCVNRRKPEWNFPLEKGVSSPYDYSGEDNAKKGIGFLTPATFTDNNNFMYNYYPRSNYIEKDLKNKLTHNTGLTSLTHNTDSTSTTTDAGSTDANLTSQQVGDANNDNGGAKRFFNLETVKSFYILRDCGLSGLVWEKNNCVTDDGKDCEFVIRDFNQSSNSASCSSDNVMSCLTEEQIECLNGYDAHLLDVTFGSSSERSKLLKDGGFLKNYVKGSMTRVDVWDVMQDGFTYGQTHANTEDGYDPTGVNDSFTWIPVGIIHNIKSTQTNDDLKRNPNCVLSGWGDALGDMRNCFTLNDPVSLSLLNGEPMTASQGVKKPLLSSPPVFFTLITPENMIELFSPTLYLKYFYDFNSERVEAGSRQMVLNFFNPKLQFDFDRRSVNADPYYQNAYPNGIPEQQIGDLYRYSEPYQLDYKARGGDGGTKRTVKIIFEKTYKDNIKAGIALPTVCVHRVNAVQTFRNEAICLSEMVEFSFNTVLTEAQRALYYDNNGKIKTTKKQSPRQLAWNGEGTKTDSYMALFDTGDVNLDACAVTIEKNLFCYEREAPSLSYFVMKPDEDMDLLYPVINVYTKPISITAYDNYNKPQYAFTRDDSEGLSGINKINAERYESVYSKIINKTQGIKLSLERSYCSKAVYDYLKLSDIIAREEAKDVLNRDVVLINKNRNMLGAIESSVIPYCELANGKINKILANESAGMRPLKNTPNLTQQEIVYAEIKEFREFPEAYGAFNEVCLSESNIKVLTDKFIEQKKDSDRFGISMDVVAFKSTGDVSVTKCLLQNESLKKPECLTANSVFVACAQGESGCTQKFNLTKSRMEYVKSIDCEALRSEIANNPEYNSQDVANIEKIKACYKGGFNMNKIVKKANGADEYSCNCVLTANGYSNDYFDVRKIKAREIGFCVDLVDAAKCPAIKYFNANGQYIDNNLALGKFENEFLEEERYKYEQHLWRSDEKMLGHLPSVFFSLNLGRAEFPETVYCGGIEQTAENVTKQCIGGVNLVIGECRGYWNYYNNNKENRPTATCEKYIIGGKEIYEYKLSSNSCQRFICPTIEELTLNEKDIIKNTSQVFNDKEVLSFSKIRQTAVNSNINNEEINNSSVDERGGANGFASWPTQFSDDFAIEVNSLACLTGYGPAGSNYAIHYGSDTKLSYSYRNNTYIDYSLLNSTTDNATHLNFIKLTRGDNASTGEISGGELSINKHIQTTIIESPVIKSKLPRRRCDQLGNWMLVDDFYNNSSYRPFFEDSIYYYIGNSAWNASFLSGERVNGTSNASPRYCERLVCPSITEDVINNRNVYETESYRPNVGKIGDGVTWADLNRVWEFSGGATWSALTAARNSSSEINNTDATGKNTKNVFANSSESINFEVNNRFKYLKKISGVCVTGFGYFNQLAGFLGATYDQQIANLKNKAYSEGRYSESNYGTPFVTQNYPITDSNYENTQSPERVCSSYGVWSGIKNNCVRACEMIDQYHTDFSAAVVGNKELGFNNISTKEIQNHDIIGNRLQLVPLNPSSTMGERERAARENIFLSFHLDDPQFLNRTLSTYQGDYLTGGAKWARTVVKNNPRTDNARYGLRYVEVEGECNADHSGFLDNNSVKRIRTYVRVSPSTPPKRRCYEDGTWGPVYADTRCVLKEVCSPYRLTIYNLYQLTDFYNKMSATPAPAELLTYSPTGSVHFALNTFFSANVIIQDMNIEGLKESVNCKTDLNSYNNLKTEWQSGNYSNLRKCTITTIEVDQAEAARQVSLIPNKVNTVQGTTALVDSSNKRFVCNVTEEFQGYPHGWNFQDPDFYNYFKPYTCKTLGESQNFYVSLGGNIISANMMARGDSLSERNSYATTHKSYVKESFFEFLYDKFNNVHMDDYFRDGIGDSSSATATTTYKDVRHKHVSQGTAQYASYQISTVCKKGFYNELSEATTAETAADMAKTYYKRNIVFECALYNNGGVYRYPTKLTGSTESVLPGKDAAIIKYDQCLAMTCGGFGVTGHGHKNLQNNWTMSVVEEVQGIGGRQDTLNNTYHSTITCRPVKLDESDPNSPSVRTAFIIPDNLINEFKCEVNSAVSGCYLGEGSSREYLKYNFITQLKAKCKADKRVSGYINGTQQNVNSYLYNRSGELEFISSTNTKVIPTTFCKDIEKKECAELTESYIANNENFLKEYCVPLICIKDGLYFDGNDVKTGKVLPYVPKAGIVEPSTLFNLKNAGSGEKKLNVMGSNRYVAVFDEKYIVESAPYDFNNNLIVDNNAVPNIERNTRIISAYDGNGNFTGSVKVCPSGQDIYNNGASIYLRINFMNNEDYADVVPITGLSKRESARQCFGHLATEDGSVDFAQMTGANFNYASGNKTVYAVFNESYINSINYAKKLRDARAAYNTSVNNENENRIKARNKILSLIKTYATVLFNDGAQDEKISAHINGNITSAIETAKASFIASVKENAKDLMYEETNKPCLYQGLTGYEPILESQKNAINAITLYGENGGDVQNTSFYKKVEGNVITYYLSPSAGDEHYETCSSGTTKTIYLIKKESNGLLKKSDLFESEEALINQKNNLETLQSLIAEKNRIVTDLTENQLGIIYKFINNEEMEEVESNELYLQLYETALQLKNIEEELASYGSGGQNPNNIANQLTQIESELTSINVQIDAATATNINNCSTCVADLRTEKTSTPLSQADKLYRIDKCIEKLGRCELESEEVVVDGVIIYNLSNYASNYNDAYNENSRESTVAKNAMNILHGSNVAEAIVVARPAPNGTYKDLFLRYEKFYKMKTFLESSNKANLTLYTDYINDALEYPPEITIENSNVAGVDNKLTFAMPIINPTLEENETEGFEPIGSENATVDHNNSYFVNIGDDINYTYYNRLTGVASNNMPTFEAVVIDSIADATIRQNLVATKDKLREYFENDFLGDFFTNINTNNDYVADPSDLAVCKNIYKTFLDKQNISKNAVNTNKFRNGFFMALKCTPNGWELIEGAECKQRCQGGGDRRLDPAGTGDWDVKFTVSGLRYGRSVTPSVGGKRAAASCTGGMRASAGIFRRVAYTFECQEGGSLKATEDNGGSSGEDIGIDRGKWVWSEFSFRCSASYDVMGGTRGTTAEWWYDGTGSRVYFSCSYDQKNKGSGDSEENCRWDTVTTVGYKATRR
jgi:hypothetical protein